MYTVYKAFGKLSGDAYYGYTLNDDPKAGFLIGAQRGDTSRVDVRHFAANNDDPDNIEVEMLDVFDNEDEAWSTRNDLRSTMTDTVSGPTMFPTSIAQRIAKSHPERMKKWKLAAALKNAKTAREAYQLGRWDAATIMGLVPPKATFQVRVEISRDLDKMTPDAFARRYNLK